MSSSFTLTPRQFEPGRRIHITELSAAKTLFLSLLGKKTNLIFIPETPDDEQLTKVGMLSEERAAAQNASNYASLAQKYATDAMTRITALVHIGQFSGDSIFLTKTEFKNVQKWKAEKHKKLTIGGDPGEPSDFPFLNPTERKIPSTIERSYTSNLKEAMQELPRPWTRNYLGHGNHLTAQNEHGYMHGFIHAFGNETTICCAQLDATSLWNPPLLWNSPKSGSTGSQAIRSPYTAYHYDNGQRDYKSAIEATKAIMTTDRGWWSHLNILNDKMAEGYNKITWKAMVLDDNQVAPYFDCTIVDLAAEPRMPVMSTKDFTTELDTRAVTNKAEEHSAYAAKWAEAMSNITANWKERGILQKATLTVRPFDASKDHCQNTNLSVWANKGDDIKDVE